MKKSALILLLVCLTAGGLFAYLLPRSGSAEPTGRLVASDTTSQSNPEPFWGELQCARRARYATIDHGGDPGLTATGAQQGNSAYRRLTLIEGDDFSGARCELGENNVEGPAAFYQPGDHLTTYFSERLPDNFPIGTDHWQTVMQMKQAQPAANGGGAPILEMEAREHKWIVVDDWHELWSFPARANTWTRFAWDVTYSNNPSKGRLQVSVDLNGDGDFNDPGERSRTFHIATLKTETNGPDGPDENRVAGDPIPSHLRLGIYHDPAIRCPAPRGCSVDVDNVQVMRAGR